MSYRKAKLLLQQKKLQQQNAQLSKQEQQQQQETSVPVKNNRNTFQSFDNNDSDSSDQPNQKEQKQQKNEVKVTNNENKKKKNKSKKNKNKKDKEKDVDDDQKQYKQEEVQKIFKEVGLQYKTVTDNQKEQAQDWQQVLSINQNRFNYQKQLKRHFGNTGTLNQERGNDQQLNRKEQKLQKHLKKVMKKSILAPGVKDFVMIREKFQVSREETGLIKFIPTKKYDHYQIEYESVRNSNDVNALFNFMQMHPEHVDSVYAVGQFLRLQGNYRDADNLIQRVLYIYEMAAGYDFNQFMKQDLVKKSIAYETFSISLFMSLFKFMDILGKKGCYRAALEYNKFLLKINIEDPTACMLCIDFNSISAKCNDYLLKFIKGFGKYIGTHNTSLYLLPNFTFSSALAKYYVENPQKPQKQLVVQESNTQNLLNFTEQDWKKALVLPNNINFDEQSAKTLILRAIILYPKLIIEISNKNQYAKQFLNFSSFEGNQKKTFKDILAHDFWSIVPTSYSYNFLRLESESDSTGLDKVMEVYVQRSKILWKSNQIMLWVKGAVGFVLNKIDLKQFDYQQYLEKLCVEEGGGLQIPFHLQRYANISKANFSDRVDRIDLANIQDNQQQQAPRNQNRMNLQGNPLTMFLNSLLPWVNLPNANNDPDMPNIEDDDD